MLITCDYHDLYYFWAGSVGVRPHDSAITVQYVQIRECARDCLQPEGQTYGGTDRVSINMSQSCMLNVVLILKQYILYVYHSGHCDGL